MTENIEKVLARGEKLDLLSGKTEDLMFEASACVRVTSIWLYQAKVDMHAMNAVECMHVWEGASLKCTHTAKSAPGLLVNKHIVTLGQPSGAAASLYRCTRQVGAIHKPTGFSSCRKCMGWNGVK